VARINVKPPTLKTRLLVGLGVVLSIGAVLVVGWGIGWTGRRLFGSYSEPTPTGTAGPTTPPLMTIPPTRPPTDVAPEPTGTPVTTSTPLPTSESVTTPALQTYVVQAGDGGLAAIAGKVCPNLVAYHEREAFAYEIQRANPEKIEDIAIVQVGIELVIPPCPP
jgi:hypothetical protein